MQYQLKTRSQTLEGLAQAIVNPGTRYSTGLRKLDKAMGGGLFAGKAYGIQARKKVGKTILMGTVSYNLNRLGTKHLWIAGEMNDIELEHRQLSRALKRSPSEFLDGGDVLLAREITAHAMETPDNTVYVNAPGVTLEQLDGIVERAVREHQVTGFVLDYLQLVRSSRGGGSNRTDHLENVAQWVAECVRKRGVWAMVAAQLNQEDGTRGGEGMLLAFDQVFTLRREKHADGAWLEMMESRYTPYANIGSKTSPGLRLQPMGPHFAEAA